ncbi:hypothetical protein [Streptomyces sp. RK9]|uniref:hypothetical protein n=1 Tax=Streptomyces sp. RK9 TaxID=3239284 RepID=UPI0038669EC0
MRHVVVLMERLETRAELEFYATEAVRHGWSRADLDREIREHRHTRAGAPPTLDVTLPEDSPAFAELAEDPFRLDFLRLGRPDRLDGHGVDATGPWHR